MAKLCLGYTADAKPTTETLHKQLIFLQQMLHILCRNKNLFTRHGKVVTAGFMQESGLFHKCVMLGFSKECCYRKGKLGFDG